MAVLKTTTRSISLQNRTTISMKAGVVANVCKLLANPGDCVNKGDKLIVLEAMKMEYTITAPCDGVVGDFTCSAGMQVRPDDTLVSISPGA